MLLLEPYGYLLWGEDAFVFYIFPTHFSLALQVQFAPYPIKPADHTASHCHENGKIRLSVCTLLHTVLFVNTESIFSF